MLKQTLTSFTLLPLLILLFNIITEVEGAKKSYDRFNNKNITVKLFVFGDSYVDTGNFFNSGSYQPPYGISFPGKPAGRFCDGRVLTDYIASFLNIKPPTPYAFMKNSTELYYGMNFAHGGTGIFNTSVDGPNMSVQIDTFEKLIEQNVYTKHDLESSIALVNAGGNDYATFLLTKGSLQDISVLTESLINQMSLNLQRIHKLGVEKIAIGLLEPIGCVPMLTMKSSYKKCDESFNLVSQNHSQMLLQIVQQLNKQIGKSVFMTLDLYNSFISIIASMQKRRDENSTLMNPLQPCCKGDDDLKYFCGSVDDKGAKRYSVCEKPESSLFWDTVHPSQNGWNDVYMMLQSSDLGQLREKTLDH